LPLSCHCLPAWHCLHSLCCHAYLRCYQCAPHYAAGVNTFHLTMYGCVHAGVEICGMRRISPPLPLPSTCNACMPASLSFVATHSRPAALRRMAGYLALLHVFSLAVTCAICFIFSPIVAVAARAAILAGLCSFHLFSLLPSGMARTPVPLAFSLSPHC